MKIAHILATADRTGAEIAVLNLSRALIEKGVDVSVIFFSDGAVIDDFRAAGVMCNIVAVGGKTDFGAVFRLSQKLREYDVVHTHGARAMFMGNLAAKLARRPVVTTFHELSTAKARDSKLSRLYLQIEGVLARFFTDHCIANSEANRNDTIKQRHVLASKITLIYNAVDLSRFYATQKGTEKRSEMGFGKDDMLIGVVGRLSAPKGTRYAIEAMPHILKAVDKSHLLVIGDGPLREELEQLAIELHVSERVHFLGVIRDLNPVYNALDVLIQPSISEAFGLAVLEAIKCGVPVVVSDVGGLPEVAAFSPQGKIVAARDSQALAAAVVELVKEGLPRTAATGLEAHFSAEVVAQQHLNVYQKLL